MAQHFERQITLSADDGSSMIFTLRTLRGAEDHNKFIWLEREVWGQDFIECLPASVLMINQKVGGLVGGAFIEDGTMVGLLYGLTGPSEGRLLHWSHMMGVHPAYRRYRLGKELKLFQREFLFALGGVDEVQWTYDPLESKNAHLNINHLGGLPVDYQIDVYGDGSSSVLQRGLGTDRFVHSWRIRDPRVEAILRAPLDQPPAWAKQSPIVNTDADGAPLVGAFDLPAVPCLRLEIPRDIQSAKQVPGMGKRWRDCTRAAFTHYFPLGYRVVRFYSCPQSGRSFYVLQAPGEERS